MEELPHHAQQTINAQLARQYAFLEVETANRKKRRQALPCITSPFQARLMITHIKKEKIEMSNCTIGEELSLIRTGVEGTLLRQNRLSKLRVRLSAATYLGIRS